MFEISFKAGFVNSITFSSNGSNLIAGVGQEHRLGRWWKVKEARNQVMVIPLKRGDNMIADTEINEESSEQNEANSDNK